MKKLDLGQMISILANIGVIAGIAFVAYELRQNNEFLQAQARESVHERRTSINLLPTVTPELASTIDKYDSGQPLSGAEQLVLDGLNRATLATFEWQFGEYRRGRLSYDVESRELLGRSQSSTPERFAALRSGPYWQHNVRPRRR